MNNINYIFPGAIRLLLPLMVFLVFGCSNNALEAAEGLDNAVKNDITMENWISHPEIIKVRDIYNEVKKGMSENKISLFKKTYDIKAEMCESNISKVSETIGYNLSHVVRYYKEEIFIYPPTVGEIEYYLDENGVTRFIFKKYDQSHNTRVYFDHNGNPIFSVDSVNDKFVKDRVKLKKYNSLSASTIKEIYEMNKECPVLEETKLNN